MSADAPRVVLNGTVAIDNLLRALPWLLSGPPGPIAVEAARLSASDNRAVEDRLNQLYDACGCGMGAACAIVAVTLYAAYHASSEPAGLNSVGATALGVAVFIVGGALGKTLGLLSARWRLVRELRDLRRQLTA